MTDQPRGSGFSTLALHAGAPRGRQNGKAGATPIDMATSFGLDGAAAILELQGLGNTPACASGIGTTLLEERMAALEGGSAALAVASGQAATLLAFHTLLQPGDEFVAARRLSNASARQLDNAFKGFGWQVRWADSETPESFVDALSDKTKAIFIESIGDGTVTDIEAIANVARRARVPLVVDNTLATPYLVRPFEHGADIVVHDATRYLTGQVASAGGLIVDGGTFDWLQDARYPSMSRPQPGHDGTIIGETFGNFAFAVACRLVGLCDLGTALSSLNAALILNGIETLSLRMQRHCDNALAVARHLSQLGPVEWVRYAGLDGDQDHELARRYCLKGAGPVLAFGLAGDAGAGLAGKLRLISPLREVGDTRSHVIHLAAANRWRLSIGLEDAADIIADLDHALTG